MRKRVHGISFMGLLLGMGFDEVIICFQEDVPLEDKVSPLKIEER